MDNTSYNKALEDLRDELAPHMRPDASFGREYPVQVVRWSDIENKIDQLKKPEDDS